MNGSARRLRREDGGLRSGRGSRGDFLLLRHRWLGIATIAVVLTLLACRGSAVFTVPEFALLDMWMNVRPPRQPSPQIVLVGIERDAIEDYDDGRPVDCACEVLCRSEIGKAVARIKAAGARVVALDMMFPQVCPVYRGTAAAHDLPLTRALEAPGETVLASVTDSNPGRAYFDDPPLALLGDSNPIMCSPVLHNPHGVIRGVSLLQEGTPSKMDIDRVKPVELVCTLCAPLSLAVYAACKGVATELPEPIGTEHIRCASEIIPVWPAESIQLLEPLRPAAAREPGNHVMWINWCGPTGTFPMYSLSSVRRAGDGTLKRRLGGKLVLLGSLADRRHTPMAVRPVAAPPPFVNQRDEISMSGLEIHANALDTMLERRFIRTLPPQVVWLVLLVLTGLTSAAFALLSTWRAMVVTVIEIVVVVGSAWLAMWHDYWIYTVIPSTAILLAGSVTAVWGYALARHEAIVLAGQVQARDAATTTLVHDLKQPLSAISALAHALRVQEQDVGAEPMTPELIDRIQQQVKRALNEIDELLSIDPDRPVRLLPESFDMATLARDLATAHSMRSPLHDIEVQAPEEGVMVHADPRLLGRALSNLMDNAIKYWPEGGTIQVTIEAAPKLTLVKVTDGGIGIAVDQQEDIFNRFSRAVPEDSDIHGTGLGLFSVRRIAEAHGGIVSVTSRPGEGSVFILSIPLVSTLDSVPKGEKYGHAS